MQKMSEGAIAFVFCDTKADGGNPRIYQPDKWEVSSSNNHQSLHLTRPLTQLNTRT